MPGPYPWGRRVGAAPPGPYGHSALLHDAHLPVRVPLSPTTRCFWVRNAADDYVRYHDHEWGFPVADDHRLFEKICLEGFQSGLSWLTILRKRENFRAAFAGFDYAKVARFGPRHVEKLLQDAGIVRHRGKIEATLGNPQRACEMADEFGAVAAYVWRFEAVPTSRPKKLTEAVLRTMATSPAEAASSMG